jgi:hypothetical protein
MNNVFYYTVLDGSDSKGSQTAFWIGPKLALTAGPDHLPFLQGKQDFTARVISGGKEVHTSWRIIYRDEVRDFQVIALSNADLEVVLSPLNVEWRKPDRERLEKAALCISGFAGDVGDPSRFVSKRFERFTSQLFEAHELKIDLPRELDDSDLRVALINTVRQLTGDGYKGISGSPLKERDVVGLVRYYMGDLGTGHHFGCVPTYVIAQLWEPLGEAIRDWKSGETKVLGAKDAGPLREALAVLESAKARFSEVGVLVPTALQDLIDLAQAALLLPLDGYAYRWSSLVDMVLGKDWRGVVYDYCPTIQAFFRQIGQQVAARKQAQDLYWEEPPNSWFKRLWWRTPWAQLERLNRAKELYSYSRVGRMHQ